MNINVINQSANLDITSINKSDASSDLIVNDSRLSSKISNIRSRLDIVEDRCNMAINKSILDNLDMNELIDKLTNKLVEHLSSNNKLSIIYDDLKDDIKKSTEIAINEFVIDRVTYDKSYEFSKRIILDLLKRDIDIKREINNIVFNSHNTEFYGK